MEKLNDQILRNKNLFKVHIYSSLNASSILNWVERVQKGVGAGVFIAASSTR